MKGIRNWNEYVTWTLTMQPWLFSVEVALQPLEVPSALTCGQVGVTLILLAVTPGGARLWTYDVMFVALAWQPYELAEAQVGDQSAPRTIA
jgi:hypothetical protein